MKDPCLINQGQIQFFGGQAGIRAGLAGEGKFPVSGFVQRDKCQRGEHIVGNHQSAGFNSGFAQGSGQQTAESVGAHFSHQGGFRAEFGQRGQKIGGRAAGVSSHGGITVTVRSNAGKVNQQFAQCDNIIHKRNLISRENSSVIQFTKSFLKKQDGSFYGFFLVRLIKMTNLTDF